MTAVTPAPTTWPAGPAPSVRLSGVSKRHGDAISGVVALQDISLDVAPGEFVCLVGASGCGKTTLLNLVAGLDRPSVGTVAVATSTVPTLGRSRPATRWSRVVFPHPEAPTRQTNSPGATSREMSWRATTPEAASPCRFDTPDSRTDGARSLCPRVGAEATEVMLRPTSPCPRRPAPG